MTEVQVAKSGKLVCNCTDDEIKECLRIIFALTGISEKLIPVGTVKDLLIVFIRERINAFTLQELRLAFEFAVLKRLSIDLKLFGDTFSPKTVIEVVEAYRKHKIEVLKREVKVENRKELSEEDKTKIIKEGALRCFQVYRTSGAMADAGNVTYNYLDKLGLIKLTKEKKDRLLVESKAYLILKERNKGGGSVVKAAIDKIQNGGNSYIVGEAKRRALKIYFDNLIEIGEELKNNLT